MTTLIDDAVTCPTCHRYTRAGLAQRAAQYKANPIYGTDFSKPLSETVAELRRKLVKIRGQLHDITFAHPAWGERTESVAGLLTCGVVTLHGIMEEMKTLEAAALKADLRIGE